jgi:hypothetical protein
MHATLLLATAKAKLKQNPPRENLHYCPRITQACNLAGAWKEEKHHRPHVRRRSQRESISCTPLRDEQHACGAQVPLGSWRCYLCVLNSQVYWLANKPHLFYYVAGHCTISWAGLTDSVSQLHWDSSSDIGINKRPGGAGFSLNLPLVLFHPCVSLIKLLTL